jgi:ankyrin repeat protein
MHGLEELLTGLLHRYGALLNAEDCRGDTALSLSAKSGSVRASRILLEHKELDATLTNAWDFSVMALAARHGRVETVKLFMDRQDTFEQFGFASLSAAALGGQVAVVRPLNDHCTNAHWASESDLGPRTPATYDDPKIHTSKLFAVWYS